MGKTTTHIIRDKEAGNVIEGFNSFGEAKASLERYEKNDKKAGYYVSDFYEIVEYEIVEN